MNSDSDFDAGVAGVAGEQADEVKSHKAGRLIIYCITAGLEDSQNAS